MKELALFSLIFVFQAIRCQAQETGSPASPPADTVLRVWFGAGGNAILVNSVGHFGTGYTIGVRKQSLLLNFRHLRSKEFVIFEGYEDKMRSLEVLGNYLIKGNNWHVAMGSGINIMWFHNAGYQNDFWQIDIKEENEVKLGIPANIQFSVHTKKGGIGLDLFGIFSKYTTGGVMLSILVGDFR